MKKIGIITFHRADNYGAVLQNYALQQVIKSRDFDVETIDYCYKDIDKVYDLRYVKRGDTLKKVINHTLAYILNYRVKKKRKDKFDIFRKSQLSLSTTYTSKEILGGAFVDSYDVIITGSDQVWNPQLVKGEAINVYTLHFQANAKKIAYAASAGGENAFTDMLLSKISSIDEISVREKSLQKWIQGNGIPAQCVCDPVLLLSKEFWIRKFGKKSKNNKYLFLYYVGSEDKIRRKKTCELTRKIAKKKKLSIRCASTINPDTFMVGHNVFSDGPKEFLNEIINADFVIASSFHAVAFSIIFEKQFITVLHENTGSRVKDFLEMLNLSDRIAFGYDILKDELPLIDYNKVNKKLDEYISLSTNILFSMLKN